MNQWKRLVVLIWATLVPSVAEAALMGQLDQLSPTPISYIEHIDFETFGFGALGDATGLLEAVPGVGTAFDFSSFTPGNIALISRGSIDFLDKVTNAENAGAIAALIYNNVPGGPFQGTLQVPTTTIPALSLSQALGQSLLVQQGDVTMRVRVSEVSDVVPEPTSLTVWSLAALGCAIGAHRRRRKFQGCS